MDETTAGPLAAEQYTFETNTSTGLQQVLFNQVFVGPNPFYGSTYLRVPHVDKGDAMIRIYDVTGSIIKEESVQIQNGESVLRINQKGLFLCLIDMENQQFKFKILSE
jgi:hypothetical protein